MPHNKNFIKKEWMHKSAFFLQKYTMVFKVLWPFLLVKWEKKKKKKCKKVIPTTTKTSREKGEEPHFLYQQNYLQLTLKLSKWKVTTTRTVTFHHHSEYPISYLTKMYGCFPQRKMKGNKLKPKIPNLPNWTRFWILRVNPTRLNAKIGPKIGLKQKKGSGLAALMYHI